MMMYTNQLKPISDLIKYIYSGEVTLSLNNISKLIEISNYLQMKVLAELCDKYVTDYLYFKSLSHQMM